MGYHYDKPLLIGRSSEALYEPKSIKFYFGDSMLPPDVNEIHALLEFYAA